MVTIITGGRNISITWVSANRKRIFSCLEFDQKLDPFSICQDEANLVINTLMEKRGIRSNNGKFNPLFDCIITVLIAETNAIGTAWICDGIQKPETIDGIALETISQVQMSD